jgi:hypothetical protein
MATPVAAPWLADPRLVGEVFVPWLPNNGSVFVPTEVLENVEPSPTAADGSPRAPVVLAPG